MKNLRSQFADTPGSLILTEVFAASAKTCEHPFLIKLSNGTASLATWQKWGVQRYKAAGGFIKFLESGLRKAQEENLSETSRVLHENLCDENGVSVTTSKPLSAGSHESWRLAFYQGLLIHSQTLQTETPHLQTAAYAKRLSEMIDNATPWQHIGALVAMEYAIGKEMELIEAGLDNTHELAERFHKATLAGRRHRLYVTHHAAHDLEQHFPDLLNAVITDMGTDTAEQAGIISRINSGARTIGESRRQFYDGLQIV